MKLQHTIITFSLVMEAKNKWLGFGKTQPIILINVPTPLKLLVYHYGGKSRVYSQLTSPPQLHNGLDKIKEYVII